MDSLNTRTFDAAVTATRELLKFVSPADMTLSNFFRKNRELGSRQRPVVANLAYSVIRNKTYLEIISGSNEAPTLCLTALHKIFGVSPKSLKNKLALKWHQYIEGLSERKQKS